MEQPLPPWGVCNLGHINLSRFAIGPIGSAEVDWEGIARAVRLGVRFLDNVIDITPYFHEKNREKQMSERRVGMGTMGLGEMLIRLGLRYGSDEAIEFIDKLYRFIAVEAYKASIDLAEEKGAFPLFEYDQYIQSGFMKRLLPHLPPEYQEKLVKTGIRNVCLTTQAPTGSTGTMVGTSTGIEPYYSWTYWRTGRLGMKEIKEAIVQEYFEQQGLDPQNTSLDELPEFFVNAMQLTPAEHIKVQAAVQRWTDSAISKTANCPNSFTVEQTRELYELAYELGCKGVTIYRDGSRSEQVLSQVSQDEEKEQASQGTAHTVHRRPSITYGFTEEIRFPEGTLFATANFVPGNGPIEFFFNGGPKDSEVRSLLEYLGRVISIAVRRGVPIEKFIEQADEVAGGRPFFYKADFEKKGRNLSNLVSGIGLILRRAVEYANLFKNGNVFPTSVEVPSESKPKGAERCEACGTPMKREEGCLTCPGCGASKCG